MIRRSLLFQASRIRPFSSLTTSAGRSSLSPSTPASPSSKLLRRAQTPIQWRNATVLSRWSSTEPSTPPSSESSEPENTQTASNSSSSSTSVDTAKLQQDLEAKTKEIADLKDKYLRSVADFRNLQDRTARDIKSAKDFAIQKFARDLLESIDNLDRALSTVSPPSPNSSSEDAVKDFQTLYDGLKMTETVLMGTLEKHGLVRFDPIGEKFDPNRHEATFQAQMEGKEPGSVFHVQSKGYSLNGRVLRAAKVGVIKAT